MDSTWTLELPAQLRTFDYETISDVVLQLSYTALDDGAFKTSVENAIVTQLTQFATGTGLFRLFSIRHDFPATWQQLTHPTAGTPATTSFDVAAQQFPYFLAGRPLDIGDVTLFLQPAGTGPVDTSTLTLSVNGTTASAWHVDPASTMASCTVAATGPAIGTWSVGVTAGTVDPAKITDVLLLVRYTAG